MRASLTGPLLRTRRQQVDNFVELPLVVEQQMAASQLDSVARHVGRNKGIAVAVPADPGAEAEHLRQCVGFDFQAISESQRLGDFAVEARERLEDGDVVVVEAHLDFVVDGGAAGADFVGLPQSW